MDFEQKDNEYCKQQDMKAIELKTETRPWRGACQWGWVAARNATDPWMRITTGMPIIHFKRDPVTRACGVDGVDGVWIRVLREGPEGGVRRVVPLCTGVNGIELALTQNLEAAEEGVHKSVSDE